VCEREGIEVGKGHYQDGRHAYVRRFLARPQVWEKGGKRE